MYKDFFGITESPFSIVPSARFLYLSERHREALTHMLASLSGGGGFGLLTGEVGTGKTTVLRALVSRLPQETQVAIILNPALSAHDLLATICDELGIAYPPEASFKVLTDRIYRHLLANHGEGRQTLLLVDEAQHLMPDVLEQLRLLTNLETESRKLLKVVLVGQPELQQLLQQDRLRQLAQRITSRYHLLPLTAEEVDEYINYRLRAVNCLYKVFEPAQTRQIAKATNGIPRLINLVCDKAMLLACQQVSHLATRTIVSQACDEVLNWQLPAAGSQQATLAAGNSVGGGRLMLALALGATLSAGVWYWQTRYQAPVANTTPVTVADMSVVEPTSAAVAASPASVPASPELDPADRWQQLLEHGHSEREAMQTLYRLWGYETLLSQANCETSSRIDLSCHRGKMSLEQLSLINRPVIVPLQEEGKPVFYAVVYALQSDSIELLLGNERVAVSYDWFEVRWQQAYSLLWRPPLGDKSTIRYGQQGPRVQWLDQQLSLLLGEELSRNNRFDQVLLDKLRRFQRAQDLTADGIAGPRTLMVIDAALNLPGPTLQPERS